MFWFLAVLEFVVGASCLQSAAWATALVILEIRQPRLQSFYASHHSWANRHVTPCPAFFLWDGAPLTFAWAALELWSFSSQPPA
jgi:hypothetical protein